MPKNAVFFKSSPGEHIKLLPEEEMLIEIIKKRTCDKIVGSQPEDMSEELTEEDIENILDLTIKELFRGPTWNAILEGYKNRKIEEARSHLRK